jgi:hypothetical protein
LPGLFGLFGLLGNCAFKCCALFNDSIPQRLSDAIKYEDIFKNYLRLGVLVLEKMVNICYTILKLYMRASSLFADTYAIYQANEI